MTTNKTWHLEAACRGLATDLFFAEKGDSATTKTALHYCNGGTYDTHDPKGKPIGRETTPPCPVKQECLRYALSFPADQDAYGIFGGLTPNQRDGLRPRVRIARNTRASSGIARETATGNGIERENDPPDLDGRLIPFTDEWRAGLQDLLQLIGSAIDDDENQRRARSGRSPVMIKVSISS